MNQRDRTQPLSRWSTWVPSLLVAVVAGGLVAGAIHSDRFAPGLTIDEPINVNEGARLAHGIHGWANNDYTLIDVFGNKDEQGRNGSPLGPYMSDYPPLGRYLLGVNQDVETVSLNRSRLVSCVAFALTVFLVGWFTAHWHGPVAGVLGSFALATMPRVVGHAHLANLESLMNLTFTASALALLLTWRDRPPNSKVAMTTGGLFGLALLTKIQAVLLPIPLAAWAFWRYRTSAIRPLILWGGTAGVVFLIGWPWLWLDPLGHTMQYFGQATERVALKTFYFGTTWLDRETPWHYPYLMALTTVPIGWLLLGVVGSASKSRDPADNARRWLFVGVILFSLSLFAIPGVVVYDGVRLFLVAFPLLGVLIGRGAGVAFEWLRVRRGHCKAVVAISAFALAQTVGVIWHRTVHLSYYNAAVGGLWGADRLGLEPTYWGESLTQAFLDEVAEKVPANSTIHVSPVLHVLYLRELKSHTPSLQNVGIKLMPYDPERYGRPKYVLFFRRRADLFPELESTPKGARLVLAVRRQGVILAGLYEFQE